MEARLEVPVELQEQLAVAARGAGAESFQLPDQFTRTLVSSAYLGQLGVNPLGGRAVGGRTDSSAWTFNAKRVSVADNSVTLHVTGTSDVSGGQGAEGTRTDGRHWEHRVQLEWEGYIDLNVSRITRLVMSAHGDERLRWGNAAWLATSEPDVAHLPAGHPIDMDCGVRYSIVAEPCCDDEVTNFQAAASRPGNGQQRLQKKMQRVQAGIRRWRQQGQSPQPVGRIMQHRSSHI